MSLETNKIFAAVLVAGIIAMLSGFFASLVISDGGHGAHGDEKFAYEVASMEGSAPAAAKGPVGPEPIAALMQNADLERGEKLTKVCSSCHTFEKGGRTLTGPNLWNVVGRAKASKTDFDRYSDAMKEKGGNWDYDALNEFLWKPKKAVPGTQMNYIGMRKPEDRAALIAWLRQQGENPPPLPEVTEEAPEEQAAPQDGEAMPAEEAAPAEEVEESTE